MPYLDRVEVTTLMLHARDDPIVGYDDINWDAVARNKNFITVITNRGGHVGWLQGMLPLGPTYSDDVTCEFIRAVLEIHSSTNFILDMVARFQELRSERNGDGTGGSDSKCRPAIEAMARICSASDLQSAEFISPSLDRVGGRWVLS